jgi:hypothetical protein
MTRNLISCALAAVLLAACTGTLSPGATVSQAPAATRGARSARVAYTATFEIASAETSEPVSMTGEGIFDYANETGRMVFDMTEIVEQTGDTEMGGEVEMIFSGTVVYMKMPFLTQLLSDPKPWIKVDLEEARRSGADISQLAQLGQSDPTQLLELLGGATRRVQDVGTEEVRGASTTHYKMVLDLARAAEKASEAARPSVENLIQRTGSPTMPADVWIDAGGRMRRMSYRVELVPGDTAISPSSNPDTMDVAMELYEFGVTVEVEPPAEDEVVDLLQLIEAQREAS